MTAQELAFCLILAVKFVVSAILAYASRYCQLKLLAVAGLKSTNEYCDYILNDERSDLDESDVADRMSWKELKSHIQTLQSSKHKPEATVLEAIPRRLSDGTKMLWQSGRAILRSHKGSSVYSYDAADDDEDGNKPAPSPEPTTGFSLKRKLFSSAESTARRIIRGGSRRTEGLMQVAVIDLA